MSDLARGMEHTLFRRYPFSRNAYRVYSWLVHFCQSQNLERTVQWRHPRKLLGDRPESGQHLYALFQIWRYLDVATVWQSQDLNHIEREV